MHNSGNYRSFPVERISKSENDLSCAKLGSTSDGSDAAKWSGDSERCKVEFAITSHEPPRRSHSGCKLHIVNLRIRNTRSTKITPTSVFRSKFSTSLLS